MPEGDTIYRAARTLDRALGGQIVTRFETQLPALGRVDTDHPIAGRTFESAKPEGKWMVMEFSDDLYLLTHMLMSGSWHIYRPGEKWQRSRYHMRIVIETEKMLAVAFNVPVAEFHTSATLARRPGFNRLGPEVLKPDFDETHAVANLVANPDTELGVALLTQSIIAGLGNVYKSETCFMARVNPFTKIGNIAPVQIAEIVAIAKKLMRANVLEGSGEQIVTYTGMRRTTGRSDPGDRLWVYRRTGKPCRQCGTTIISKKQGLDARTSFWCPQCQPL